MLMDINGFSMRVEVEGREGAPAVVLHHALAGALGTWDALAQRLCARYRVVRFDARGHGQSAAPPGPYTLPALAGDVVALLDHLRIDKAHFVGLSMGGMIGQHLALDHAGRIGALVLVSTTSRIPAEARPLWRQRIEAARSAAGMSSQVEAAIGRWLSPGAQAGRPDLARRLAAMIEATPVEGYVGWCEAIARLDLTDRLGEVRAATTIVVGELDPGTPVAAAQIIHRAIAGSHLHIMPGMSHMLPLERPDDFAAIVEGALAQSGAA